MQLFAPEVMVLLVALSKQERACSVSDREAYTATENRNKEAEPEVQARVQMVKPKRKITKPAYLSCKLTDIPMYKHILISKHLI